MYIQFFCIMDGVIPNKIGPYKVFHKIGTGSFSTVYQGCDTRDNKPVAMKFVERKKLSDHKVLSSMESELRIAQRISHKSIVKIYDTIFLEDYIILVMESLRCGTLTSFKLYTFVSISDATYLRWGKEILEGLEYLHERKISHHDIKPDNIGFDDDMHAKIFDFGLCEECMLKKKSCRKTCGTPLFIAPEILSNKEYDGDKADIWSFGVTFHYMVTGELPFNEISDDESFDDYITNIKRSITNKCKGIMKDIVDFALNIDPRKRPSAHDFLSSGLFSKAERLTIIPTLNGLVPQESSRKPKITNLLPRPTLSRPTIIFPCKIKVLPSRRSAHSLTPPCSKICSNVF